MVELEKILNDIVQTIDSDENIRIDFKRRIAQGSFSKDENKFSHFCVYFAAYDPAKHLVFIGHHRKSGLWLFNGGHMDKNETPWQSLKREIKEEWGIDMEIANLAPALLTVTNIINNPAKRSCKTHYDIWFFILLESKKFTPDNNLLLNEFYEIGWKTLSEARSLAKDPNTIKGLDEIEKFI
jgi:8-oxo-dGTP pyrophosphatase MutT (NUDIX family)